MTQGKIVKNRNCPDKRGRLVTLRETVIVKRGETNELSPEFSLAFCLEAFLYHHARRGPYQNPVVALSWERKDWGIEGGCGSWYLQWKQQRNTPEVCIGIILILFLNTQPQIMLDKEQMGSFQRKTVSSFMPGCMTLEF